MRGVWIALLSIFVSTGAFADELKISPHRISAVVTSDWNNDGRFDRAMLVDSDGTSDLLIYLSVEGERDAMKLYTHASGIAWRGGMWGQQPELSMANNGSLFVTAMNESIGRNRWTEKLTIAYRNNDFVVAGYTFESRDTLDPDSFSSCDVNLLTGKGVRNEKPFRIDPAMISVSNWTDASAPRVCRAE